MALSVPCGLGSEVPFPNSDGSGKGRVGIWYPGDLWFCGMRGCGIERATGSCASGDDDPAEGIGISSAGTTERADVDEDVPAVPVLKEETVLGQSFLVQRVLRGHSGTGCGHDTQVCPLPGKERTADGATSTDRLNIIVAAQPTGPAPLGAGTCPPYGGIN